MAAGVPARDLDRVLVGLGAAVGEEGLAQVLGRDLLEQPPGLGARRRRRGGRRDIGDLFELGGDRGDHARVAMAQVGTHQLRIEVHIALAVGIPQVDALGVVDHQRLHRALHGPFVERGLVRDVDNLLAGKVGCGHGFVSVLTQSSAVLS